MKRDLFFLFCILLFFLPFFLFKEVGNFYREFNAEHGMLMSFIKFGVLATLGELIGLRIKTGSYFQPGFGIVPKMIIWGFIGLTIKMTFIIFSVGTPAFLEYIGYHGAIESMSANSINLQRVITAFSISATMNIIYAPVMMIFHKITDTHVLQHKGKFISLFRAMNVNNIISQIDWKVQWGFVFRKTIPLFWIPAHTITFLLPPDYRVLFAALLSIVLGIILAVAAKMGEHQNEDKK